MQNLIRRIKLQNFKNEILDDQKPVLLLCMPSDDDFPDQIKILEHVALSWGTGLHVGLMQETDSDSFKEVLHISGTPTFLMFHQSKEINRMLGLADKSMLESFIEESMNQIRSGR